MTEPLDEPYRAPSTRPEPSPRANRVPAAYFTLFCSLYAIQGVVFAYVVVFNQGYMLAAGVSEPDVADLQGYVLLPLVLKFLAAPLSDRFNVFGLGHRRPFIALGLAMQLSCLVLLAWIDPGTHYGTFAWVAVLAVVGLAIYDTCTDGFIIDATPPADRSRIQGWLGFWRFLTATVSTLGFGLWLQRTGTGPGRGEGVLYACAGLTALPLALTMALREPRRVYDEDGLDWRALGVLLRPSSLVLIAFGTVYATISWGVEINLPIFYETRLGYEQDAVGLCGSARTLGRAFGFLLLPVGTARLSRRGVLLVAVLGLAATEAAQGLAGPGAAWSAAGLALLLGMAIGWTEGFFYVMAMEASDPRLAASTFALLMAVTNVCVLGSPLFYRLVEAFDGRFPPAFVAAGGAMLVALLMIRPLARKRAGKADAGGVRGDA